MNYEQSRVAKFGGTSMSHPEQVAYQLEQPGNQADTVVVSAPGLDEAAGFTIKVTDMLRNYQANPSLSALSTIQSRYDHISPASSVVSRIPKDIEEWEASAAPIEALGEYWAAQQFAELTGRAFIDARRLISVDAQGNINIGQTTAMVQRAISPGQQIVVPGFYGLNPQGKVGVMPRGGSDNTGAALARATNADAYHNWSDVPGFMTADPRIVPNARLNQEVSYREARELGSNGSQLLHPAVIKLLGKTGIDTHMRQTYGPPNAAHTVIRDERVWQSQPIAGVTGRNDVVELSLHQYGINEASGTTAMLYQWLRDNAIAYTHAATGTDDVSLFFVGEQATHLEQHIQTIPQPTDGFFRHEPVGLVHIVGEGLTQSGVARSRTLGKIMMAFADADIESRGSTDVSQSASLTMFVRPEKAIVQQAITTAHGVLFKDLPQR